MSFIRTRTINGRQYRYLEERYREGGKVRSKSKYLGRGGNPPPSIFNVDWRATLFAEPGPKFDEEAMLRDVKAADAKYAAMKERFTAETGLKVGPAAPTPVDKTTAPAGPEAQSPSQPGDTAPSAPSGSGEEGGQSSTSGG